MLTDVLVVLDTMVALGLVLLVLLHSGRLATVAMLPAVVADYRAAGYQFVTVGDLLKAVSPDQLNHPRKNPLPGSNRGVAVQP